MGRGALEELRALASRLSGTRVLNVNSTYVGGGVAEILARMVPLLRQLGVDTRWSVIHGDDAFFQVTKKFHNAIHGRLEQVTQDDLRIFMETSDRHLSEVDTSADVVFVHDPQPVALVRKRLADGQRWAWRCHIDVSRPNQQVWDFLRPFVVQYNAAVFSAPQFSQELPIPQYQIAPSIDPLSDKNGDLTALEIDSVLKKYGVTTEKPLITQISRFDYLKDPVGLIEAFKLVRKSVDCALVLAGGTAADDPESDKVLAEVRQRAADDSDIHVLLLPPGADKEVNALQRASAVVVQKSIKEGFGLTVSEALWKARPVVASAVGGIPLQVKHGITGLLSHGIEGTAYAIRQFLTHPDYARQLGENGREHVRHNFLITRHLRDYLLLFLSLNHSGDVVYL